MTQREPAATNREQSPTEALLKTCAIIALSIIFAVLAGVFMTEHRAHLTIAPATVIAISFIRFRSPRAPQMRNYATLAAMVVFNGWIIFTGGLTIPESKAAEATLPSLRTIASLIAPAAMIYLNVMIAMAWNRGQHLAVPDPAADGTETNARDGKE